MRGPITYILYNGREKINSLKFLFDLFLQYIAHTCYYYMITLLSELPALHVNKDGERRILKNQKMYLDCPHVSHPLKRSFCTFFLLIIDLLEFNSVGKKRI